MRPIRSRSKSIVSLCLVSLAAIFAQPANCDAGDSAMIRAWKRTFYGPNPLATPLRGYFVPRLPSCGLGWQADDCGCQPTEWLAGLESPEFERLGQIPNDLDVGAAPVGR